MPGGAPTSRTSFLIEPAKRIFLLIFLMIILSNAPNLNSLMTHNPAPLTRCQTDILTANHSDNSIQHFGHDKVSIPSDTVVSWNYTYGGSDDDQGTTIIDCSSGGFAICGRTRSFGAGDFDVWLLRLDSSGSLLWSQTYGGVYSDQGLAMVECSDGGFAIVGWTRNFGAIWEDVWLVRTDLNGSLLWQKTYGGIDTDVGQDIIECSSGGFAILGWTESYGAGISDMWLLRTDTNGTLLWNQTHGDNSADRGYSLVESETGGLLLLGYTRTDISGRYAAYLVCTDANGVQLWSRTYWGPGYKRVSFSMTECHDGWFIFTAETGSEELGSDLWIARVDIDGNLGWSYDFGGVGDERGFSIIECSDGGYAVVGETSSFSIGGSDIWLVRFDEEGNHLWDATFGGGDDEIGYSIVESVDGGFVFTGYTASYGAGQKDLWVIHVPDSGTDNSPPSWVELPTHQFVELGESFYYELNAQDSSGLHRWWLSTSGPFMINSIGVITNSTPLGLAGTVYWINVYVNDTHSNELNAQFSVTVVMPGEKIIPFWLVIAGSIIVPIQLTILTFLLGPRIKLIEKLKPRIVLKYGLYFIIFAGILATVFHSIGYISGFYTYFRSVGGFMTGWRITDAVIACWAFSNFCLISSLLGLITLSFFGLAFWLDSKPPKKWKLS